ncbi:hypothetical protein [Asticcacaulis sp.]|uniref:hypothetical protein n=1 Tax=Asticcacaulis sp. TaxID=1872648 RepID=UPI0026205611|nr:hypothetical protein [Asticcacaulis sp.]
MRRYAESGFVLPATSVKRDIFIPRYYDPRIGGELADLSTTHHLLSLDQLIAAGDIFHDHGKYIPKIYYGTGAFPYIRTSDIANCEIKASPKHGVSQAIYDAYKDENDVKAGDILFVHEGTYLIGATSLVTPYDGPMLYQHHLAKFRVAEKCSFPPHFLLAAINAPLVQRQIRSKQFSADIIDSVVGRVGEVIIPVPKDRDAIIRIANSVRGAVEGRAMMRERLTHLFQAIDVWLRRAGSGNLSDILQWMPDPKDYQGRPAFLGERPSFTAFTLKSSSVKKDIFIPKYYDPSIPTMLTDYRDRCDLITISSLVGDGSISIRTGDEIGRLNYGTGENPFIRTSDLGSYELKSDAKHGVNDAVLSAYPQGIAENDILLVRDGTYLVGSSVMVKAEDLPLLYCGGIYNIQVNNSEKISPALLYAALNLPVVRAQMRRKQFTRDVIDTLGHRLLEVVLPIPKDPAVRSSISDLVELLSTQRVRYRAELDNLFKGMFAIGM